MFNGFNISTISDCYFGNTHVSEIYYESTKVWPLHDYRQDYLTIESLENNNVITYCQSSTTGTIYKISWSYDTVTWTEVTPTENGVTLATLSEGQKIYLKGDNTTYARGSAYNNITSYCYFTSTGTFNLFGNIMSLLQSQRTGDFRTEWYIPNVQYTFTNMFRGSKVVNAENLVLPATTIRSNSYNSMFRECTNLVTPPTLGLNTTTGQYSYFAMFKGCTSLTSTPEFHTTTMNNACYRDMFSGCTSLTTAPVLPATTLADSCYRAMFYNCTSLTSAPELLVTTLVSACYQQMFQGCTNLNYIKCLATDISASSCTSNWVKNVAPTGTFIKDENMISWTIGDNGIPTNWTIIPPLDPHDYSQDYLTFTALESGTFSIEKHKYNTNDIKYSLDNGSTWTTLNSSSSTPTVNAGSKILWKETMTTSGFERNIGVFSSTGRFIVSGNIMSLLYGDNFIGKIDMIYLCNCKELFEGCKIIYANNLILPATRFRDNAYASMFAGCTSLVSAPSLPATNLTDHCYADMFSGCTSLTTAPNLPALSMSTYCYYEMFENCTSLTTAPIISATSSAEKCCAYMFQGCTSLTTAPELKEDSLLAPYCYQRMFDGCTSLNYVKCLSYNFNEESLNTYGCVSYWLNGVSSTGTFVKKSAATHWPSGSSGIPTNWTVQNA